MESAAPPGVDAAVVDAVERGLAALSICLTAACVRARARARARAGVRARVMVRARVRVGARVRVTLPAWLSPSLCVSVIDLVVLTAW